MFFFQYFAICSFCTGNALVSEILSDSVKLWDAPFASPLSTCTCARPAEKSRLIHLRNLHCYSSNISTQFGFLTVHPIYMLFFLYQTLPISLFPKKIENWQTMLVSEFSPKKYKVPGRLQLSCHFSLWFIAHQSGHCCRLRSSEHITFPLYESLSFFFILGLSLGHIFVFPFEVYWRS